MLNRKPAGWNPLYVVDGYVLPGYIRSPAYFTHASGSVDFQARPVFPDGDLEILQARGQSTGGDPFNRDMRATEETFVLSWPRMCRADAEALWTFFNDTVNGMAETFVYTDLFLRYELTVRFADPVLDLQEKKGDVFAARIRLRVDP